MHAKHLEDVVQVAQGDTHAVHVLAVLLYDVLLQLVAQVVPVNK
jgi:hypothetical protein